MRIAEATEQLAQLLRDYYEERDSEDPAISFLVAVARITKSDFFANDPWWQRKRVVSVVSLTLHPIAEICGTH